MQDSWKVSSNLTVNYGMRMSLMPPWYERNNLISGFEPQLHQQSQAPMLYQPFCANGAASCSGANRVARNPLTGQTETSAFIGIEIPGVGNRFDGATPAGTNGVPRGLQQNRGIQWGPRFGFAWTPFGARGKTDSTLWRAYPVSFNLDKRLSGINRQQTVSIYYVYNLPFGKGHTMFSSGPAAYIVGGWQISGIITRYSGLPFTVGTTSAINAGGQGTSATQINPVVRILGGHDANDPYFDGTAFINPPGGTLGTTGQNLLIGPGLFQMNASIQRTFAFKEDKVRFQLVGEAYNLTNTVVFSNPGGSCCWTTNTNGTPNYNGFGLISATQSTPRYLEVGGYLRF